jgi:hypothetical protein
LFYTIPLTPIDLSLTLGYNGFKYKNEYFTELIKTNLLVGVSNFDVSWTATDIPIMVGARYKIPGTSVTPYISGEVGLHLMSFSDRFMKGTRLIGSSSDPSNFSLNGSTESGSETGFGAAIGVGVEIPVAPKINIDINAKYNYAGIIYSNSYTVFRNNNSQFTTIELKNASFFTIRGSIIINF